MQHDMTTACSSQQEGKWSHGCNCVYRWRTM